MRPCVDIVGEGGTTLGAIEGLVPLPRIQKAKKGPWNQVDIKKSNRDMEEQSYWPSFSLSI